MKILNIYANKVIFEDDFETLRETIRNKKQHLFQICFN